MSYFEKIQIQSADSPSIDAFARLRTSNPTTGFDSKLIFSSSLSTYWSTRTWGNATSSFFPYDSLTILSVGTESGSRVAEQTKQQFIYEPGKSLSIVMTGNFCDCNGGYEKYIMYGNDTHGLGFCSSGSSFGIIKRNRINESTVTTTFISQSDWNIDKFDGTGPSGKTHIPSFAQIYFVDMEWLGVGRVRYGIFQGGLPYYIHQFSHINELDSPYIGTPNLPVRYEIVNKIGSATTSSMRHICCSVISEGGSDSLGVIRSVDLGATPFTIGGNDHCAVLAIRHTTGSNVDAYRGNASQIRPLGASVMPTGNTPTRWAILLNPTIPTSASFGWTPIGGFGTEYATGSATTEITNQGTILASGYLPAGTNQVKTAENINIDPFFAIGEDLFGNRDVIALAVWNLSGTSTPIYASLNYRETI